MAFFSNPWLRVFCIIGIYIVLGLGINVVVGYAGLLDLGYVAFFATGAYVMAIFTSPSSAVDFTLAFWVIVPLAVLVGALVGLLLGMPVLPLRGDYLAIVTLGFGEIVRILLVNFRGVTNGSQGLSSIGKPEIFYREVDELWVWYYIIVVVALVTLVVTTRLRDARIGRAWEAIREDEDAAAAMGINTVKYKLMAFSIGAAVGALGGVFYASFIGFINPQAFTLQVSINVLALVIIGGMGSTTGVIFGAFVLIGVPQILEFDDTARFLARFEWLRESVNGVLGAVESVARVDLGSLPPADEWGSAVASKRFIIYGALLVVVMALKPAGLFPTRRRRLEVQATKAASAARGGQ